jgi:hypothetical protein
MAKSKLSSRGIPYPGIRKRHFAPLCIRPSREPIQIKHTKHEPGWRRFRAVPHELPGTRTSGEPYRWKSIAFMEAGSWDEIFPVNPKKNTES